MKGILRLCSILRLAFLSTLCSSVISSDVYFEDAIDDDAYLRREHCLTKPYHGEDAWEGVLSCSDLKMSLTSSGTGMDVPFWEFGGSTVVTSSYVRLTPDRQSKRGILWNTVVSDQPAGAVKLLCFGLILLFSSCLLQPVSMHNWEVVIQFQVHGQGKHLFGDGFAFWYTKEKGQIGNVFGSKDYFTGLGVFFDTYSNHNGEHKVGSHCQKHSPVEFQHVIGDASFLPTARPSLYLINGE